MKFAIDPMMTIASICDERTYQPFVMSSAKIQFVYSVVVKRFLEGQIDTDNSNLNPAVGFY